MHNKILYALKRSNFLFRTLGCVEHSRKLKISIRLLNLLNRWISCEGKQGMDRWKANAEFVTQLLLEQSTVRPSYKIHRTFYTFLNLFRNKNRKDLTPIELMYALTVLRMYRLYKGPVVYDLESITKPWTGDLTATQEFLANARNYLIPFSKSLRLSKPISSWDAKWYLSTKAGPNGSPATKFWNEDLYAIVHSNVWKSVVNFLQSINVNMDGPFSYYYERHIANKVNSILNWNTDLMDIEVSDKVSESKDNMKQKRKWIHSKLSFLQDKGFKTRVIAILDIYTQSVLKPAHDSMMLALGKIPSDGTKDQQRQVRRVKEWSSNQSMTLYSIDMKSCTDRFPVFIQKELLKYIGVFSSDQAEAWASLLSDRSFHTGRSNRTVNYSVGQPMGALSSWPGMALAHHALVWVSYARVHKKINTKVFECYSLLGDDIVINDDRLASEYLGILNTLGIEVALEKSIIKQGVAEFAKAILWRGFNCKPLPLTLFMNEEATEVSDTISLITELADRDIVTSLSTILKVRNIPSYRNDLVRLFLLLAREKYKPIIEIDYFNDRLSMTQPEMFLLNSRLLRDKKLIRKIYPHIEDGFDQFDDWDVPSAVGATTKTNKEETEVFSPDYFRERYTKDSATHDSVYYWCNTDDMILIGNNFIAYPPEYFEMDFNPILKQDLVLRNMFDLSKDGNTLLDNRFTKTKIAAFLKRYPGYMWPSCHRLKGKNYYS